MTWRTKYNLWKINQAVKSGVFKKNLWQKLDREFDSLYSSPSRFFIFRPAVISSFLVLILLFVGGIGTSVYAYVSPNVNQSHPLFVLKKSLESVEVAIAKTPEKKLEVSLKQRQKRLKEIEVLKDDSKINEGTLSDFNKSEDEIISKTQDVTSLEKQGSILQRISEQNIEAVKKLKEIKTRSNFRVQEKIEKVITKQVERAERNLEIIKEQQEKLLEKQRERLDNIK